jgi:hypothetical protein
MDNINKISNMRLSVFNGISMNKIKVDILKSGLQKYIRRGMLEKSLYCLVELDMFKKLKNDKKVKGLRSNIRNRIIVILNEDIGISNWEIYERIDKLLKLWEENRNSEDDNERKYLLEIIYYLVNSKKIRLCSWIKGYFGYCMNDEKIKELYENYDKILENEKECGKNFYKNKDSEEIKEIIDGIVYNLNKNSDNVFYWILKILRSEGKSGRRGRRGKKGYIVWDIMLKYIEGNDKLKKLYDIILNWYIKNNNSRNENLIYLINFVLFYLRREKIDWERKLNIKNIKNEDVKKIYGENLNNKMVIDKYIIDMHCKKGRRSGKNARDFVKEGSVVVNECEKFKNKLYEKVYEKYKLKNCNNKKIKKIKKIKKKRKKKIKLNKKLEEDLEFIDFKELMNIEKVEDLNDKMCRKNTCGGKAMTFFNKEKNIIVKEMRKSFNYGRDSCVVDDLKNDYNIKKMKARRIKSNMIIKKKDKKNKFWENNMEIIEEDCVYLIMDMFDNIGTLVKNKKKRIENKISLEYLKIILFRGIFRLSDGNYTNVLINEKDELLSIDENNIGKREKVFDRRMYKGYKKEDIEKVLDEMLKNKEEKLKKIKEKLIEYELEDKYEKIKNDFDNLKEDVKKEFEDLKK